MTVILMTACQPNEKRYTQQSPEIETVKKLVSNYNGKIYDTSVYADTSKTFFNSSKEAMTSEDVMNYHKINDANYSSRGFTGKDPEYEMVVTDEGKTWVNCWLDWKATLAGNGKEVNIPVHLTYQFVNGKIVREVGYWDPTEVVLNLQAIEAASKATTEEDNSSE